MKDPKTVDTPTLIVLWWRYRRERMGRGAYNMRMRTRAGRAAVHRCCAAIARELRARGLTPGRDYPNEPALGEAHAIAETHGVPAPPGGCRI